MARGKNNVQVTGDFILRAQMDIGNAEKQAQRIYQVLNNAEFKPQISKTFFTGLNKIETLTERIKDNLASGTLEGDGLKEYLRDANALTKEMTNLERALQKVGATDIKIDDSELKYLQSEITVVEQQMGDLKKGFTLDTTGILSTDRNLKQISESIDKAIKNGESLQATLNNLSQTKQQDVITQTSKISGLEQVKQDAEQAIPKLEELLNKHRELEAFLQSSDKRKADRERFNLLRGEANEALGSEFTSKQKFTDKRVVIAQEILRLEQEINATKSKAKEVGGEIGTQNKVLTGLREYQAVLQQIQAQNQGGIGNFDQEMLELQIDFTNITSQTRALGDALAQALIKQLRDAGVELGQLRAQAKGTAGGVKELAGETEKEIKATDQATESFKSKIAQMFGLYNVYRLIRKGIQDAYNSIKQLDQSMNEIAVVTNMTTNELWGQIDAYMAVAKQYGVATQGVYEVSKLYYQQGRDTQEVTKLTAETLKMAKIAGLDYSKATDYMTVALNGFKLAAEDASMVVDVYSKLAAVSATDTEELAYAMSKTASIAESAGMSFQNTTVFLAQMIETTREAPENIGTAMKTIIARFQEMKKSPLELVSVEGEEISFNRVDKALQSIGMTLQDANGQFKDLDDVIYELADKWDTLDRNTQRYIATIVAGSRQQSRFLALMQDSNRLRELQQEAMNSEDAGLVQYYKTLDSVESKLNQLSTSVQQFYMQIINGPLVKGVIDVLTTIVTFFNRMSPERAIFMVTALGIALKKALSVIGPMMISVFKKANTKVAQEHTKLVNSYITKWRTGTQQVQDMRRIAEGGNVGTPDAPGLPTEKQAGGMSATLGKIGAVLGWIGLLVSAGMLIFDIIKQTNEEMKSIAQQIEDYEKRVEEAKAKAATSKAEVRNLEALAKKWEELNNSVEKNTTRKEEWLEVNKQLADAHPGLISGISDEGTAIVNLTAYYDNLLISKKKVAEEDARQALRAVNEKYNNPVLLYADIIKDDRFTHYSGSSNEDHLLNTYLPRIETERKARESRTVKEWETLVYKTAEQYPEIDAKEIDAVFSQLKTNDPGDKFTYRDLNNALQSSRSDSIRGWGTRVLSQSQKEIQKVLYQSADLNAPLLDDSSSWNFFESNQGKVAFNGTDLAQRYRKSFDAVAAQTLIAGATKEDFLINIADSGFPALMYKTLKDGFDKSGFKKIDEFSMAPEELSAYNQEVLKFIMDQQFLSEDYAKNFTEAQRKELTDLADLLKSMWSNYDLLFADSQVAGQQYLEARIATQLTTNESFLTIAQKQILRSTRVAYAQQEITGKADEKAINDVVAELAKTDQDLVNYLTNVYNEKMVARLDSFLNNSAEWSLEDMEALEQEVTSDKTLQNTELKSIFQIVPEIKGRREQVIKDINAFMRSDIIDIEKVSAYTDRELIHLTSVTQQMAQLTDDAETGAFEVGTPLKGVRHDILKLMSMIAERKDLTDEQRKIFESIDPSTYAGMEELIVFAEGLTSIGDDWERFIDVVRLWFGKRRVTAGDLDIAFNDYAKAAATAFELADKSLNVEEIINLVGQGTLNLSDIDIKTGKIKDPKAFLTARLADAKAKLDEAIAKRDDQNVELYNFIIGLYEFQIDMIDELADDRLFLTNLTKNYDFKTKTLTVSEEDFQKIKDAGMDSGFVYDALEKTWSKTIDDISSFYITLTSILQKMGFDASLIGAGFRKLNAGVKEDSERDAEEALKEADKARKDLEGFFKSIDTSKNIISLNREQYEAIGGKLSPELIAEQVGANTWEIVIGMVEDIDKYLESIFSEEQRGSPEYTAERKSLTKKLEEQNQEAAKKAAEDNLRTVEAVLKGIDTETGNIKIGRDLYEKLSPETQSFLTETGFGEYGLGAIENFSSFMDGFLQSVDLTDPHAQAGLKQMAEELQQKKAEWYDAIYSLVLNMLQNVDETFAEARRGFSDKRQAMAIASKTRFRTEQNVSTGKYDFFDENGIQVEAVTAVEAFYKAHNINIKMSQKLVKEEHKGLKDLATLQKQYAELQEEILELGINQTDQQIAKQYQLAKAIASLTFDPETYSFMSNSPTNEKLSPMYALMDNVNQAFNQLNQAGQKDGTISNQDLNAILDYVDPAGTNQSLEHLRTMARTLEPPMQIALDGESIGLLQGLTVKAAQQQVDDYNNQVAEYKKFLEAIDSTQYDFDEGKGPRYYGEEITDSSSLMTKLRETVEKPVLDQALQTAMKLLGPDFDVTADGGQKKLIDTLISVLTREGILTDTQQEEAAQELASSMTKSNEAITNLTTAINTLTDVIGGQSIPGTEGTEDLSNAAGDAATQIDTVSSQAPTAAQALDTLGEGQDSAAEKVLTFPQAVTSVTDGFSRVGSAADGLAAKLQNITFPKFQGGGSGVGGVGGGVGGGAGDLALAQGGPVEKSGKTLVGEFGPEIAFANGRYQILGARGPEFVNLPAGANVFNHKDTARILRRGTSSFDGDGKSLAIGSYKEEFGKIQVHIDLGKWLQNQQQPTKPGGGGSGGEEKDDKKNTAEFDRWYNYLQLIADVERAVDLLSAARENLSGEKYAQSLANEIKLLRSQEEITTRFRDAQATYLQAFEKDKIGQYAEYLQVVGGVLQIEWDKLNGMDNEVADPIQKVIEEWESLKDSINESNVELENFKKRIQDIKDEMRDNYIEVEKKVIEAIKYQHQMQIDNLQKQLDMKIKYDQKYLDALRKSIDQERKMRERSDQEEDRAKLQRKLAMLKRDTSGKSALAIAQAEEELRSMNRSAYDQRQDDFVQQEEDALLAAQEAIKEEIEVQTEVLRFISENTQLIQTKIDELMQSGTQNLTSFLTTWSTTYQTSTPTEQKKFFDETSDMAGKVKQFLEAWKPNEGEGNGDPTQTDTTPTNYGNSENTNLNPSSPGSSGGDGAGDSEPAAKTKYTANWTCPNHSYVKLSAYSFTSQAHANRLLEEKKQQHLETHIKGTGGGRPSPSTSNQLSAMPMYSKGGLVDYTGPALVHGSKQNPEAVLNPTQTAIFQHFVDMLDTTFGQNIQNGMVKQNSMQDAPISTTIIVENINVKTDAIRDDYSARRAGERIKEEILDIVKYKGNMSLRR